MAEFAHDPAIGSWFFQAQVQSSKLDRMTKNTRAAHWNKPRATRYRESALITTTQTQDLEQMHMLFLCGVRVIWGPTQAAYPHASNPADVRPFATGWYGDPQLLFPTGIGLAPFVERPIVTANAINFEIEKTAPLDGSGLVQSDGPDEDYSFVNWFGGLDWGAATGATPDGIQYNVNQLFDNDKWLRVAVERPTLTSNTGQAGAVDTLIGLKFRIIFGRLGGSFNHPGTVLPSVEPDPRAYYIHWHAMGPVAAY